MDMKESQQPVLHLATGLPIVPQQELPGMPEKGLATMIAEEILILREKQNELKEEMVQLKDRFVNEMRVKKISSIIVRKHEFEVEIEDKVKITKTKKAF